MWSDFIKNPTPKSLKECLETRPLSRELSRWADYVNQYGKMIFALLVVCGVIYTLLAGMGAGSMGESWFWPVVITALVWALISALVYCAYHVLSLLLQAAGAVVQSTAVSANVAVYEAAARQARETADHPVPPQTSGQQAG